ncbi:SDR family oxidoreductase [Ancylobacter moscoviensis]
MTDHPTTDHLTTSISTTGNPGAGTPATQPLAPLPFAPQPLAPAAPALTLAGARIVVLGGSSGIGLKVAEGAAAEGARVVVVSSNGARVRAAVETLPAGSEGRTADLSEEAAVAGLFAGLGAFDHLVYTAGEALSLSPLDGLDIAQARRFFGLRYWGALAAAKHARAHLRPGGSIVFTSGTASARPKAGWAVPASICGAMEGLTRALAFELAPRRVRVNAVAPGVVRTPLWRGMSPQEQEALFTGEAARLPVGRVAGPEEIALGYLYLMRQPYVTGQTLTVDGGEALA